MAFRVASAQFAPRKGDREGNLDLIAEVAAQAREAEADLLVLPETIVSGYFLEGGVLGAAMPTAALTEALASRLGGGRPLDLALGYYEAGEAGALYNSAAYFQCDGDGVRPIANYRKTFLPTYGVFDEERFVERGRGLAVFPTRLGTMAILVCEDVWHGILPLLCALKGADVLLVPAASPARGFGPGEIANHERYRRLFRAISEEHGMWCVSSQLVGFEGGKGFVGGSMVVDPFGEVRAEAPVGVPAMILAEVSLEDARVARVQSPLLSDLRSQWPAIQRLVADID